MQVSISGRLSLMLLSAFLLLGACSVSDDSYKTMNVKTKIASFSFEYRAYYRDVEGPEVLDRGSVYVNLIAPEKEMSFPNLEPGGKPDTVSLKYVPAYIGVAAYNPEVSGLTAAERIERVLYTEARWPDYRLLERSAVIVDGIQAELIAYQTNQIIGPRVVYMAKVYFDYGGFTWAFDAKADHDLAETVRADFNHVLKTFKILE